MHHKILRVAKQQCRAGEHAVDAALSCSSDLPLLRYCTTVTFAQLKANRCLPKIQSTTSPGISSTTGNCGSICRRCRLKNTVPRASRRKANILTRRASGPVSRAHRKCHCWCLAGNCQEIYTSLPSQLQRTSCLQLTTTTQPTSES